MNICSANSPTSQIPELLHAIFSTASKFKKAPLNFLTSDQIFNEMLVERTNKEVIIRLPASVDTEDLQDFLNYARYKELTSNFNVDQKEVDKLADQVNSKWWTKNRKKLIK